MGGGWPNSYRLTGDQGCMNGLPGGVGAVGDVKPWRQQAPEILHVRRGLGISAFRRTGSGSGTLAVGACAAGRRRRQTLPRCTQGRLFPLANHVILLDLDALETRVRACERDSVSERDGARFFFSPSHSPSPPPLSFLHAINSVICCFSRAIDKASRIVTHGFSPP